MSHLSGVGNTRIFSVSTSDTPEAACPTIGYEYICRAAQLLDKKDVQIKVVGTQCPILTLYARLHELSRRCIWETSKRTRMEKHTMSDEQTSHLAPATSRSLGIWSEDETASRLEIKVQTLRAWAARRKGPPRVKIGRSVYYRPEAIQAWLAKQEHDPAAARRSA